MKLVTAHVVLICALMTSSAFCFTSLEQQLMEELFNNWKLQFNKTYESDAEAAHRFAIYSDNMAMILKHNAAGTHSYTMSMNEFGDMSWEEFKATHLNGAFRSRPFMSSFKSKRMLDIVADVPESVDWVAENKVSEVKNQGQCGSCWAFSTTGAIESAVAIATGTVPDLSEQQLVDCAGGKYGNNGCYGGLMDQAFAYVMDHGLCTEDDYKYEAKQHFTCHASKSLLQNGCKSAVYIKGFQDVPANNPLALKAAVAQQPISVAIEADDEGFQFYSGGVWEGDCGTQLDHGVLLVGYGVEESTGNKFWKVKNSWGESWGENGYIRFKRSETTSDWGMCGIAEKASYPIVCNPVSEECGKSSMF